MTISSAYRSAIKLALIQQILLILIASLMLDGGATARACWILALTQWAAILLIVGARPNQPTRFDLVVVRHGFWLLVPIFQILVPIISRIKGVS